VNSYRDAVQSRAMTVWRSLALVALIAALHGVFFIWYQRPDWYTEWSDQDGYRRLGRVLAETGRFTRFPDATTFVPEVIRTPAYPLFVATIYKVAGFGQLPVALVQTGLFVLICLLGYAIAARCSTGRLASAAAVTIALFPPIPYFGALVLTEVWTTFLLTLAVWVSLRAVRERHAATFAVLGFLLAVTTLSRPVFVLFPIVLALTGIVGFSLMRVRGRPTFAHWSVMLGAFAITMLPWLTYNYVTLGSFTLSPAGGIGRGLWEGSWQATWSGRLQNELTHFADDFADRGALDRAVQSVAAREHLEAAPMLEYVHQWQDIRRIWTDPVDPQERARARVRADREYLRVALANLSDDSPSHLVKRLARGTFVLWAGEIPFRYSDINSLPLILIRVVWAAQALVFAAGCVGIYALVRRGRVTEALLLASPIAYITFVHFPLLTEARQSLPAQPLLLVLATFGVASLSGHSFPLEAQVHEREHL
jgi:dolichyl-phosphate-mannose-protein mannosyltransferase